MSLISIIKKLDAEKLGLHIVTDSEVKQIQNYFLELLIELNEFCNNETIEWFLGGGSLLGTVRHKGFIPWDDDVDIHMTRENFNKFQSKFDNSKILTEKYILKIPGDKEFIYHFPRIYIKGTSIIPIQSTGKSEELALDIFIMENTYDNKILRFLHGIQCNMLLFIDSVVRMDTCKAFMFRFARESRELEKAVKNRVCFAKFFKFYNIERWMEISNRCFSKVKNNNSKLVVCTSGSLHYFGELYDREKMCQIIELPFEGEMMKVPAGYQYVLSKRYGEDYMLPPPAEKIEKHVYVSLDLG